MKLLLLGSGAKDHAIGWWLSRSNVLSGLLVVPGNIGTEDFAKNLRNVNLSDGKDVINACKFHKVDHVFIGTEAPLITGVVDSLQSKGIKVFGAPLKSVRLESDRAYARTFTQKYGIPTPKSVLFEEKDKFEKYIKENEGNRFVIKSNTLSPSRIMLNSIDGNALIDYGNMLLSKGPILVEEAISGIGVTCTLFVDHKGYFMLPLTSDYTHVSHTDNTPTGGMGSVCPVPLEDSIKEKIKRSIVEPTLEGLKNEGLDYHGVLTCSLVINHDYNPILVDYHVRFNDPATQAMVPIIENDLGEILMAAEENEVSSIKLRTSKECTVAVILAAPGYPIDPDLGLEINGVSNAFLMNAKLKPYVFCGAIVKKDGVPTTTGGRIFTIVGHGKNIEEANKSAYSLIYRKNFYPLWYRDDIGSKYFQGSTIAVE